MLKKLESFKNKKNKTSKTKMIDSLSYDNY
jgi:hypothetical protein